MSQAVPWTTIEGWIARSRRFMLKKLSRNDTSWADDPSKHQSGAYVPRSVQDSKFFPDVVNDNPSKPHIYRTTFLTYWPQTDEVKESSLRHFSNKGSEAHLTRVPRSLFKGLTPASWLIGGYLDVPHEGAHYWLMVIDSASESAELLETALDLGADFEAGVFTPLDLASGLSIEEVELQRLIDELREILRIGGLEKFLRKSRIPGSALIAVEAQRLFLDSHGIDTLDPYVLDRPGDALMLISRDIEYRIYKKYELRLRAAEIVQTLARIAPDVASMAVRGFTDLYLTFLSTSQQRKTRAGRSFERHVGTMLQDGRIAFEEQAVTGGRRPDFVLPTLRALLSGSTSDALVLSCKTTLKERWKQVTKERFDSPVYLATVDDRVTAGAIDDMRTYGIKLVVPESLKESKDTCYVKNDNVISFRDFFGSEIRKDRPSLILAPRFALS